ncbi:MAG TPA: DNA mismatch repair protein MutS [Gemmatimonadales bacterium]
MSPVSHDSAAPTPPMLKHWREMKAQHRNAILFYRVGDFYEMFNEDAELAAKILEIALTSRGDGVPLAGVPVKAAAEYLRQLVGAGHRVAICEQVEDPKLARGLVRREVVETVTPGALLQDGWVAGSRNNWLVALQRGSGAVGQRGSSESRVGVAYVDLSTGEFVLETVIESDLEEVLSRLLPAEIVVSSTNAAPLPRSAAAPLITSREPWEFDPALARDDLARRFNLASLDGLGIGPVDDFALGAAGALLRYLTDLQPAGLPHLARPAVRRPESFLWLDEMTRRNLELVEPLRAGVRGCTLLETIDATVTPMGGRLLRQWLLSPLSQPADIDQRLDAVEIMVRDSRGRSRLREALDGVRDLERLAGRAASGRATPREMGALRDSFQRLPDVAGGLTELAGTALPNGQRSHALAQAADELDLLAELTVDLEAGLADRLPATLGEGEIIRPGYDPTLDELRSLRDGGRQYIAALQQRERERTGISSLKVGFNKVFGYYLEVTHTHTARIPADYERRQTLATAERYVTPELKEYESKVLGAEERIASREAELFGALRAAVGEAIARIQRTAHVVARLDVWAGLAERAVSNRYVRPIVSDRYDLVLRQCRHPVIERMMPRESFIPNDARFTEAERVALVTGPNMAGKSTILRQIGLCVILAQLGSFVPAEEALVGVVDRLFTRVGASDNLAGGQSTFMVEMSETSAILHNATAQSLVLLDEIGRGTSTYDGVAIAWAVTEHLHDRLGCKTMFATHYHELMQLPERLQHARNFNVAVQESGDTVLFLHRLEPGGTNRSYGIHVGQLAGLPTMVVSRAKEILSALEGEHRMVPGAPPSASRDPGQLGLFNEASTPDPMVEELRSIDVNSLTPLEALNRLADFQRRVGERK